MKDQEPKSRKPASKKGGVALATCPVDFAGWCPYPFSIEQLQRRINAMKEAEEESPKPRKPGKKKLVR
jgi:hypothetical protein